jgi:ParB family transcriptional regulator, chromosome partitioning protein
VGTVPVLDVTGWSDEERRAYLLADNALAEQAGWDYGMLGEELRALDDAGFDMGTVGFSNEQLDDFLGRANAGEFPNLPDGDRAPFQQFTFTLHDSQAAVLQQAMARAREAGPLTNVNENSNGNALARICAQYLKGRDA